MQNDKERLASAFETQLRQELPMLRQKSRYLWTCKVGNERYYVTLDIPTSSQYGEIIGVYYGTYKDDSLLKSGATYQGQKEISFPFKLHKPLFALFTPFSLKHISYIRWLSIAYRKKLLYGNEKMTDYSIEVLVPYAVSKIGHFINRKTM